MDKDPSLSRRACSPRLRDLALPQAGIIVCGEQHGILSKPPHWVQMTGSAQRQAIPATISPLIIFTMLRGA